MAASASASVTAIASSAQPHPNLVVIPASDRSAQAHYKATVLDGVRIAEVRALKGTEDLAEQLHTCTSSTESVRIWGSIAGGKRDRTTQLRKGDIVLFYAQKKLISTSRIAMLFSHEDLSRHLWGTDKQGNTWNCMYALENFTALDISWALVQEALGYKDNFYPRGMLVYDTDSNERYHALEAFLNTKKIYPGSPPSTDALPHNSPPPTPPTPPSPASSPIVWSDEDTPSQHSDTKDDDKSSIQRIVRKSDPSGELTTEVLTEGGRVAYLSTRYERSKQVVQRVKQKRGHRCEACGFDFESTYGERGHEYIQVHHLIPISTVERGQPNLATDFAVLCANCHVMVHRRRDALLCVEELKDEMRKTKAIKLEKEED